MTSPGSNKKKLMQLFQFTILFENSFNKWFMSKNVKIYTELKRGYKLSCPMRNPKVHKTKRNFRDLSNTVCEQCCEQCCEETGMAIYTHTTQVEGNGSISYASSSE